MNKPKPGRVIGIDFGLARIGVAYSDERKVIAMPMLTLHTEKKLEATVKKLLIELEKHQLQYQYTIEEIIVGLPLMMSGKQGLLSDEVRHFIEMFTHISTIPIHTWDERLTSVQAERSLQESEMTRKKRTKYIDTVSAVILLQSYLDHKHL